MDKLKTFIFGGGRLNRRQFLVMLIVQAFLILILYRIIGIVLDSYLSEIIATLLVFPLQLAYTIRRGNDFSLDKKWSILWVLFTPISLLFPMDSYIDPNSLIGWLPLIVNLIYLFYPGNKGINKNGDIPLNSGNVKTIFRYLTTGKWAN